MLTEKTIYITTVYEDGQLSVKRVRVIIDSDGTVLSRINHSETLEPGRDMSKYPDARAQAIAALVWTPEVVGAYKAVKEAQLEQLKAENAGSVSVK